MTASPRSCRPWLARVWRLLRAQPKNHLSIWSAAAVVGVAGSVMLVELGRHAVSVCGYAFASVVSASVQNHRLSRRRDAAAVADWVASRRPSKLPGE